MENPPPSPSSATIYAKRVDKMRSELKEEVMRILKPAFTKRLRAVRLRNAKRFIELARCVNRVEVRLDSFEKRMDVFMETLSDEIGVSSSSSSGSSESTQRLAAQQDRMRTKLSLLITTITTCRITGRVVVLSLLVGQW